jgi:hypothetical protein
MKNFLRACCSLMVVVAFMALATPAEGAEQTPAGWTCQDGVNGAECCECTREPGLRVCRAATTSGQHSEKCGLDDESVCTGYCMLVLG